MTTATDKPLPWSVPQNWRESKTTTAAKKPRAKARKTVTADREAALSLVSSLLGEIGRKLEARDVEGDLDFFYAADLYLDQYRDAVHAGTRKSFDFLDEMVNARERFRGDLTHGQIKGILNCLRADLEREAKRASEPEEKPRAAKPSTANAIPDGYYTLVTEGKDHVTLRLRTAKLYGELAEKLPAGTQVAAYLAGSDNTQDYVRFAWVFGARPAVWKRFKEESRIVRALNALLSGDYHAFGMAYALQSNHCCRCGKRLTVPASINRGLGPECAEKGW